jgi:hypothetical protein
MNLGDAFRLLTYKLARLFKIYLKYSDYSDIVVMQLPLMTPPLFKRVPTLGTSLLILPSFLYVTDTAYFTVLPTFVLILACSHYGVCTPLIIVYGIF